MRRSATTRTRRPVLEGLETRALLNAAATPDFAAMGVIERPGGVAVAPLSISSSTFTAPGSGRVVFQVQVTADEGGTAEPRRFVVLDARGRTVGRGFGRAGVLDGRAVLGAGDYRVVVQGGGAGTGPIVVTARMAGDVDGDHDVDATDIDAIRAGFGASRWRRTPFATRSAYDSNLDLNGDSRVNPLDLATARRNLGAQVRKVKLLVQLAPDAKATLGDANLRIAYTVTTADGGFAYLNKYGVLTPMKGADNSIPINGTNYADFSIPLSDPLVANGIDVDANIGMNSTRIWISANAPIYFRVVTQGDDPNGRATGIVQPSVTNPSDVNYNTIFDVQEFSLAGDVLYGNLTQVDMFGLPMTLQFVSASSATNKVGIDQPRDVVLAGLAPFLSSSGLPADLAAGVTAQGSLRALSVKDFLSPFADRQAALSYFQPAIDQLWAKYPAGGPLSLSLKTQKATYAGQVTGDGMFTFTPVSGSMPTVKLGKPTSWNVFASNGPLAPGNDERGALGAQISAALNRGVSNLDSSQWENPANFYPAGGAANYYAQYWHTVSLGGLAYGFDYDDVGNQSTLLSIPNATQMTVTVHWNRA